MDSATLARMTAAARVGFGAALVLAPERVTGPWLGRDAARTGTRVVSRGLGARDVALGMGALVAPSDHLRHWVIAAIAADTADCAATALAGASIPRSGRILVGGLAATAAVLGAVAVARMRPASPQL